MIGQRPPYFERSENAAPIWPIEHSLDRAKRDLPHFAFLYSFLVKMSEANKHSNLHVSLRAMIGQRPPYFERSENAAPIWPIEHSLDRAKREFLSCSSKLSESEATF